MKKIAIVLLLLSTQLLYSQRPGYWQQSIHYDMNIDFDVENHQFKGEQQIQYVNNSPDTLNRLYFHLYFNAFQAGSMMDQRSQDLPDPDGRIANRIGKLKQGEMGYHRIDQFLVNGAAPAFEIFGTLMRIDLLDPILPGDTAKIECLFHSQVPLQVRRSGRMNSEGVDYTMTQWYPKMAEYSERGWHTQQYVNREFFGVFGSFDVHINIDSEFILGGTGVLQNACELDKRVAEVYCKDKLKKRKDKKQTWHFHAENVHDFAWAADDEYEISHVETPSGVDLYFLRLPDTDENSWLTLEAYTLRFIEEMSKEFGAYPYEQFSVIQGGDGGMEYPMCTMILGRGGKDNLGGMIALMVHEAAHNWYYGVLGFDEQRYPWMDEGFTTYAENVILNSLFNLDEDNPHEGSYKAFRRLKSKGFEEALTTPADHYQRNRTYGASAYSMGNLYLSQLEYIVGREILRNSLREFFNTWKFKHPEPNDLLKIIERRSGMQLHWFHDLWIGTTQSIDYALLDVRGSGRYETIMKIRREGSFPMPLEVLITLKSGSKRMMYVPTDLTVVPKTTTFTYVDTWPWTMREKEIRIPINFNEIEKIEIDPMSWMADVNTDNQTWSVEIEQEKD